MTTITSKNRTVRYSELPNTLVSAANGIDYAYRDTGPGDGVPLVLLQHFRGNLDNWDPALIDAVAADRRVVTFDYAGVGGSTGETAHTVEQMAHEGTVALADRGWPETGGGLHTVRPLSSQASGSRLR